MRNVHRRDRFLASVTALSLAFGPWSFVFAAPGSGRWRTGVDEPTRVMGHAPAADAERANHGRRPSAEDNLRPRPVRPMRTLPPLVPLAAAVRAYNRHLDQTGRLITDWTQSGPASVQRSEIAGLLRATETELQSAATLLEEKFARIRAVLVTSGDSDRLAEFDDFLAGFRQKERGLRSDLGAVAQETTPAAARSAAERVRALVERRKVDSRARVPLGLSAVAGSGLPNEPIVFRTGAPARASTTTPAYLGGDGETDGPDLDPTPDAQITPEVQQLAQRLGYSALRIYEYVRNSARFEPYFGSLKGSQATLETLGGNDYDLASLTIALLRAANIPSRYVRGTVKVPTARAQSWLGVRHADAVNRLLNTAGIDAVGVDVGGDGTVDHFEIDRVWVEAQVPHANYRGVDGSSGAKVWVPLDPAFKLGRHQAGISGVPDQVPFDEAGYFAARTPLLAYEWYQNQVRAWLETNLPGRALSDVPYSGTPVREELGLLPASLPEEVLATTGEWTEVPETLRHRYRVTLLNQFGGTVLDRTLRAVETASKRITISYAASGGLADSLGGLDETPAFLATLTPQLKLDGTVDTSGSTVNTGDPIDIRVRFHFPDDDPVEELTHQDRRAGDYHALSLDLFQIGETLLNRRAQLLLDANANVGTPLEDRDALVGELLNVTGQRYWHRLQQGDDGVTGLFQYRTVKQLYEVLVSSNTSILYLYDRPFAVTPGDLNVDSLRQAKGRIGIDGTQSKSADIFRIEGRNGSAQEHAVWEEVVHVDSISTIKSLQYANEIDVNSDGTPNSGDVLTITAPAGLGALCTGFPTSAKQSMQNSLSQGRIVKTPQCDFAYNEWNGVGWIEEDPATGAGAYLISGFLAGGSTTRKQPDPDETFGPRQIPAALGERLLGCAERAGVAVERISRERKLTRGLGALLPPHVLAFIGREIAAGREVLVSAGEIDCLGWRGIAMRVEEAGGLDARHYFVETQGGAGTEDPPGGLGDDPGETGDTNDECGSGGEPVSWSNGNMFNTWADVVIPGPDMPLLFARTYNSLAPADGPLGFGWTHNYNVFLVETPGCLGHRSRRGRWTECVRRQRGRDLHQPTGPSSAAEEDRVGLEPASAGRTADHTSDPTAGWQRSGPGRARPTRSPTTAATGFSAWPTRSAARLR